MTDYWKSTPKHYCKYCNCWLTDSKSAKFRHENGRSHQDKMAMYYKNRREDKERAAIDRDQTAAALRAIEKAAKAAYSKDVANFAGTSGIYLSDREREAHRLSTLAPPPAPALPSRRRPAPPPKEDDSAEQKPTKLEQPFLGQYTVDGKVYLEGEHFEMKIARNMACELWNETADDWVPAVVVSVAEVSIPNTNRTFRQYKVKFQPDESSTNIADALTATVRADALRLVPALPPPVEKRDQLREEAAKIEVASDTAGGTRKVDKHTGYGQWSTVTLSVEQTQEQDHQRRVAATSVFKQSFVKKPKRNALPFGAQDAEGTMDAYAQYNPHGGAYRGVDVEEEAATLGEMRSVGSDTAAVPAVTFKKRKKMGGRKKKSKMRKSSSLDD